MAVMYGQVAGKKHPPNKPAVTMKKCEVCGSTLAETEFDGGDVCITCKRKASLGAKLLQEIRKRGYSMKSYANHMEYPESTLKGWISGRSFPPVDKLMEMCVDMEVSADEILGIER